MSKIIACVSILVLLLSGCASQNAKTTTSASTSTSVYTTSREPTTTSTAIATTATTKATTVTTTKKPTVSATAVTTTTTARQTPLGVQNVVGDGRIVCYSLRREGFYEFIQSPTEEYLNRIAHTVTAYYRTHDMEKIQFENLITGDKYDGDPHFVRLGYYGPRTPVYDTLVEFLDNPQRLQEYLRENGATGTVKQCMLMHLTTYPDTIFIETDSGHYFMTIDDSFEPDDEQAGTYVYSFYTSDEFLEKFLPVAASVFVNGKNIGQKDVARIHNHYVDIPMVAVFEALGLSVDWKNQTEATVVARGKNYTLDLKNPKFCKKGSEVNILVSPAWTWFYSREPYELILNDMPITGTLYIMGLDIDITWSREEQRIDVTYQGPTHA